MKAYVIEEAGGPEALQLRDIPSSTRPRSRRGTIWASRGCKVSSVCKVDNGTCCTSAA